jgi:ribonucleoside-diphosphate reductase beta chain
MKLFNPGYNKDAPLKLIGGDTSNIMNLNTSIYKWSTPLYKTMMGNFWIPEEISLGNDAGGYKKLSKDEQESFDKIISFLVFLDSLQTISIPHISDYITLPEIKLLFSIHSFQEAVHSQSYAYVLESVVSAQKRQQIYDIAIENEHLRTRNEYIANIYQKFVDEPNDENFIRILFADFLLEGLYFYSGFAFFYNLAKEGKMTGVGTMIKYINRDEATHLNLFTNLIKELRKERPDLFDENTIQELKDMAYKAVEHEISWAKYAFAETTPGLTPQAVEKYIKWIANQRMKSLDWEPLFEGAKTNPLSAITRMANFNSVKTDFFEEKVINYSKSNGNLKLDDLDDIEL